MKTETFTLDPENYRPKDIAKYRHLSPRTKLYRFQIPIHKNHIHSGSVAQVTDAYLYHIKKSLINFLDDLCDKDLRHKHSFKK